MPPPPLPPQHIIAPHMTDLNETKPRILEIGTEQNEEDTHAAGKACFDTREFARAAHVLRSCSGARGKFLKMYSTYLVRVPALQGLL
jgi:anaphase-promoting complex subunit 8